MRSVATAFLVLLVAGLMAGTGVAQTSGSAGDGQFGDYVKSAFQWGGGQPYGSYQQTCQNIRTVGNRLEARCRKEDGGWRDTSINYRGCRGEIVNDDGNLRCDNSRRGQGGGWWGGTPRGDFEQTCQNVRTVGNRLEARCQRRDGGWRDTSINYRSCRGEIINDDGNLRCDTSRASQGGWGQGGWRGGLPEGDYQQSCQNARMNGDRLEARCRERDGDWRDTSIDVRGCRGEIVNDDGNLRCDTTRPWRGGWQGGGWQGGGVPQGDYQQTCQNARVNGDRLEARCREKDGDWRDTSLDLRGCRGAIVNDDGNLRCDTSRPWQGGGIGGGWFGGVPQGDYQQSCQNVRVNGDRLEARCEKRDGGWRDTSIQYRACRGGIINDDGNLRCQ